MNYIFRYLISLSVFLIIDFIWLTLNNANYKKFIGHLMEDRPNLVAAFVFYLIFIFGLLIFVINPALANANVKSALLLGALFGIVSYSTYDLTNLATLKDWPLKMTIIDIIWGGTLSMVTSVASYYLIQLLKI